MADVLQRLRTRILPVTSPASVERILGPNAANLVFFGVVERETTSLFRSRKKVLLVISYTSIFWFDVDTGCPLRMIKIRELASPLTLNNAGFGSVVLRVAGENDALLHFVDSSKQGELSTPDVSTVDNFVAKLKQLHRIFVPDKELEVEKVDLKPEELKKAKAAIGKIKGQPSTRDKILRLKEKAADVQREYEKRGLPSGVTATTTKCAAPQQDVPRQDAPRLLPADFNWAIWNDEQRGRKAYITAEANPIVAYNARHLSISPFDDVDDDL